MCVCVCGQARPPAARGGARPKAHAHLNMQRTYRCGRRGGSRAPGTAACRRWRARLFSMSRVCRGSIHNTRVCIYILEYVWTTTPSQVKHTQTHTATPRLLFLNFNQTYLWAPPPRSPGAGSGGSRRCGRPRAPPPCTPCGRRRRGRRGGWRRALPQERGGGSRKWEVDVSDDVGCFLLFCVTMLKPFRCYAPW